MAKVLIAMLLGLLVLLWLLFAMFNDNPTPRLQVGDNVNYMMSVCETGIVLCLGALIWLFSKKSDNRSKK